jgi:hypothetical protein
MGIDDWLPNFFADGRSSSEEAGELRTPGGDQTRVQKFKNSEKLMATIIISLRFTF